MKVNNFFQNLLGLFLSLIKVRSISSVKTDVPSLLPVTQLVCRASTHSMIVLTFIIAFLSLLLHPAAASFLKVNTTSLTGLSFDRKPVFLSGANLAWIDYGNDFGNNQSNAKACQLQQYVRNISANGGNTMRVWLFVEGQNVPQFDSAGMVLSTDATGSMVQDLKRFLIYAATQNVFIILTLWNGALMR